MKAAAIIKEQLGGTAGVDHHGAISIEVGPDMDSKLRELNTNS
jgi:hypothetical protein